MILKRASLKAIKYSTQVFHYAKTRPGNSVISYSVFNNKNEWCGCIVYGSGACPAIGDAYNLKHGQIIELVRMALNGKQESTSKALAISLKLVKKHCPTVKMIVSYADEGQNHKGIIYQATNWYYVGRRKSTGVEYFYKGKWRHQKTMNDRKSRTGLKIDHLEKRKATSKLKYMYPFYKEQRNLLEKICKPYPKKLGIDGVKVAQLTTSKKAEVQYLPQCSN